MRVLIIDDNKAIIDMVALLLKIKGIDYKISTGGREGLELIKKEDFDLIILDLAMPEFSGVDIMMALREEDLIRSKNIMICTASSISDKDVQELIDWGAKGVLKKPISIPELTKILQEFDQPD